MTKRAQQTDGGAPAKKVRNDDDDIETREELSFVDEAKSLLGKYGADGTNASEILLSLMRVSDETKDEIREHIESPKACNQVVVKQDAFLNDDGETWASHDPELGEEWLNKAGDLENAGIDEVDIPYLSKPSGPKRPVLTCLWDYPTFTTKKPKYGLTLDRTNPCLRWQWRKIADHSKVRTQDTYPMRTPYDPDGPKWEKKYGEKTPHILQICHDFAKDAVLSGPFCIIVGKPNAKLVRELLHKEGGLVVQEVGLRGSMKLFSEDPCLIVRSKDSGKICHIMFFSYHGMWFLKNVKPQKETLVLHDLLWNVICQWSGVPVADECLFSRRDGAEHRDILHEVIYQRHQEKVSGINARHEEARDIMSRMLAKPQHIDLVAKLDALDETNSVFEAILEHWNAKGQATRATDEWKDSEAAERQRAGREKGLDKSQATRATDEWKNSEAAERWRAGLEKGRATLATDEWKNSEAGKRSRANLEKARATRTQQASQKWAMFYNHPEVQRLINPERQDALSPKHRKLAAKIQAANVAEGAKQRAELLNQYAIFQNGNIVAVAPKFIQWTAEKKKQILAEMSETAEMPETPVEP